MTVKDKAQRLFEFIAKVYAVDLPIDRDITQYGDELWWQADILPSSNCVIKAFDGVGGTDGELTQSPEVINGEDAWLSVSKRSYDEPPTLPSSLPEWVNLSSNPTRQPSPRPSILKGAAFDDDVQRGTAFKTYVISVQNWIRSQIGPKPSLPDVLSGWVEEGTKNQPPIPIKRREFEEKFESDQSRVEALKKYLEGPWKSWSDRVLPQYKANLFYDQLFSLFQRLTVEGDRLEIIWGHLFLAWDHRGGDRIYHPLLITPMNLHFDPVRRNMTLAPNQTTTTKLDLDCLMNLEYPLKDRLIKFSRTVNNDESPPDPWNNNHVQSTYS